MSTTTRRLHLPISDMNKNLFIIILIIEISAGAVWGEVLSCSSCGSECQSACGTRYFRTCCFNYLKKRTVEPPLPLPLDPSLRLELWLAKSRNPFFQDRNFMDTDLDFGNEAIVQDREEKH